ncbi:hypothetical protein ACKI2N_023850 [Cupriavidus sp. 30B13]|uniref:hypothetical protein n=1 Tax=Cupriavidus sp. 30B13 TaxID=3384241 RepID=UPI003B8F93B3
MTPPHTYAEWSACLEAFGRGDSDEIALDAMRAGTLSWSGGVAPLFARRISEVLSLRLQRVADEMARALRAGHAGAGHVALSRTLLDARRKLWVLSRLAQLPALPAEVRDSLQGQLRQYASQAQQSLEDSAQGDRSGQLASVIRHNALVRFDTEPVPEPPPVAGAAAPSPAGQPTGDPIRRRRNILA